MAVLQEIQRGGDGVVGGNQFGWRVLRKLWNVTPAEFDGAALTNLNKQPLHFQQHLLLSLATNDLRKVKNLSAFLSYLLHDQEVANPVCLAFLAGCCQKADGCFFLHPTVAPGWQKLQDRWQVGWLDFDYLVLNSLLQKPIDKQDDVLWRLGSMRLKAIRNLSAVLASVVAQCEKRDRQSARPQRSQRSSVSSGLSTLSVAAPPNATAADSETQSPFTVVSDVGTFGHSDESEKSDSGRQSPALSSEGGNLSWVGELEAEAVQGPWPGVSPAGAKQTGQPCASVPVETAAFVSASPWTAAPYQISGPTVNPAPCQGSLESQHRTAAAAQILRACLAPPPTAGWQALRCLWNAGPADFDPTALQVLRQRAPIAQEHILLSIAAMDVRSCEDLTAVLLLALNTSHTPVCWRYLVGLCQGPTTCCFHHPAFATAWDDLCHRQGVTRMDVDYAILNVFLMLPLQDQDRILKQVARHPLQEAEYISGLLLRAMERATRGN